MMLSKSTPYSCEARCSDRSPGSFFFSKELINNAQLHVVKITAALSVISGGRQAVVLCEKKQHSERLFCVLCFDNKPRKDRRAQSRCCLRLGKEGCVISRWSSAITHCCFELKYHSLIHRQTLPSRNTMMHSYFSSSVQHFSLYQSVHIKCKEMSYRRSGQMERSPQEDNVCCFTTKTAQKQPEGCPRSKSD